MESLGGRGSWQRGEEGLDGPWRQEDGKEGDGSPAAVHSCFLVGCQPTGGSGWVVPSLLLHLLEQEAVDPAVVVWLLPNPSRTLELPVVDCCPETQDLGLRLQDPRDLLQEGDPGLTTDDLFFSLFAELPGNLLVELLQLTPDGVPRAF